MAVDVLTKRTSSRLNVSYLYLIGNQGVVGSNPTAGTNVFNSLAVSRRPTFHDGGNPGAITTASYQPNFPRVRCSRAPALCASSPVRYFATRLTWAVVPKYDCPQCGPYMMSDAAYSEFRHSNLHKGFVSGSIRRMSGKPPVLTAEEIGPLAKLPMPSFSERVEAYLSAVAERMPALNDNVSSLQPALGAIAYCSSKDELQIITNYLEVEKMLDPLELGSSRYRLSAKGRMRADELRASRAASSQGFIAMWFHDDMDRARRDGLEVGIRAAGYKPHRVDDEHHIDQN